MYLYVYKYMYIYMYYSLCVMRLFNMQVNGEAIYNSVPWKYQNDTPAEDVWYTASKVSQQPKSQCEIDNNYFGKILSRHIYQWVLNPQSSVH